MVNVRSLRQMHRTTRATSRPIERGQSAIELALFLPLFLLALLGMAELGNGWYGAIRASQAAHEGAEYARRVQSADDAGIGEVVSAALGGTSAVVGVSSQPSSTAPGGTLVTVSVRIDLPLLTGNFLTLFTPFEDGVMRVERSATSLYVPA